MMLLDADVMTLSIRPSVLFTSVLFLSRPLSISYTRPSSSTKWDFTAEVTDFMLETVSSSELRCASFSWLTWSLIRLCASWLLVFLRVIFSITIF